MFQQGVTTGEHHDVDVGLEHEPGGHRGLVHSHSYRSHHSLFPQLDECADALGRCLIPVIIRIVQVDDVEVVDAQTMQARLDAAKDRIAGEVELPTVGRRHREAAIVESSIGIRLRHECAPGFGREHEVVAGSVGEQFAQSSFRVSESVVRGGVESTRAELPGCVDCGPGLLIGRHSAEVSQLGAAQSETRKRRAGAQMLDAHQDSRSVASDPMVVLDSRSCTTTAYSNI